MLKKRFFKVFDRDPFKRWTCEDCKNGKHRGTPHCGLYNDQTGGTTSCTCRVCNKV